MKWRIAMMVWVGLGASVAETIEERLAALEKRVAALEEKGGSTEMEAAEEQAAADEGGDVGNGGPIRFSKPSEKQKVQLRKGSILNAYVVTKENHSSPKRGEPIEKMTDESGVFKVGNILSKEVAKGFEKQHLGVRWQGYFWIEKPGVHDFSAVWAGRVYGVAQLYINNQLVADVKSTDRSPKIGQLNFAAPGMYEVEIWVAPSVVNRSANTAQCDFQIRAPGGDKFEMLSPGLLYSQK